jgi:dihydrofolate reductase
MRNVVLSAGISLDGYIARPDGSLDWLTMDPALDLSVFFTAVDVAIMGRKTYDAFKKGPPLNMEMYVFSNSLPGGMRDGAMFLSGSPAPLIQQLKARQGKHIWLAGGGEMALACLKEDLVDQIDLGLMPVLLGDGVPLFPSGFPQRNFKLAGQRAFKNGMLTLSYTR